MLNPEVKGRAPAGSGAGDGSSNGVGGEGMKLPGGQSVGGEGNNRGGGVGEYKGSSEVTGEAAAGGLLGDDSGAGRVCRLRLPLFVGPSASSSDFLLPRTESMAMAFNISSIL